MNAIADWQEWLTVSIYLGITFIVIWGIFSTSKK